VAAIHGAEGDTIGVGELLAEIAADTGGPPERPHASNGGEQTQQTRSAPPPSGSQRTNGAGATNGAAAIRERPTTDGDANGAAATTDQPKASPVARRIAAVEHIDLTGLAGTGTSGRITKADVLDALHDPPAIPAPAHHAPATPTSTHPPATQAPPTAQAPPPAVHPAGGSPDGETQTLRGAAAMLAQYMDDSRQIPTATSLR